MGKRIGLPKLLSEQRNTLLKIAGKNRGHSGLMVSCSNDQCQEDRGSLSLHFSPRGEAKCVRGPPGRGVSYSPVLVILHIAVLASFLVLLLTREEQEGVSAKPDHPKQMN